MKKLAIILMILLAVAGLVMAEDGRRESGLGLSYGRFVMGNEASSITYDGYGLEFYSNYKAGFLLGFGSSSNYYFFSQYSADEGETFYEMTTDEIAVGITALMGPSIEINLGGLGFQVLGGIGFDFHYYSGPLSDLTYLGLIYGADARVLLGFTKSFRLYGGLGATLPIKPLVSDYYDDVVMTTAHATLGLQIAR